MAGCSEGTPDKCIQGIANACRVDLAKASPVRMLAKSYSALGQQYTASSALGQQVVRRHSLFFRLIRPIIASELCSTHFLEVKGYSWLNVTSG